MKSLKTNPLKSHTQTLTGSGRKDDVPQRGGGPDKLECKTLLDDRLSPGTLALATLVGQRSPKVCFTCLRVFKDLG